MQFYFLIRRCSHLNKVLFSSSISKITIFFFMIENHILIQKAYRKLQDDFAGFCFDSIALHHIYIYVILIN